MKRIDKMIARIGRKNTAEIIENGMELQFLAFQYTTPEEVERFLLKRIAADTKRLDELKSLAQRRKKRRHLEVVK